MTLDERIKAKREERLALLVQREQLIANGQQIQLALQQLDRSVFACDGAVEALTAVQAEEKAEEKADG